LALVPKLYLGTQLLEQLHCEVRKAQLPGHARSQVQLGNEKRTCRPKTRVGSGLLSDTAVFFDLEEKFLMVGDRQGE